MNEEKLKVKNINIEIKNNACSNATIVFTSENGMELEYELKNTEANYTIKQDITRFYGGIGNKLNILDELITPSKLNFSLGADIELLRVKVNEINGKN